MFHFFRETRAGATAITAAAVTVMSLFGTALIVDHVWLVDQRDMLKSAADAAAVAATLKLQELPGSMSDEDVRAELQAVAERYIRFNLAENLTKQSRATMLETLAVSIDEDRALGTVGVSANADLGGTLLSRWFLSYARTPGWYEGRLGRRGFARRNRGRARNRCYRLNAGQPRWRPRGQRRFHQPNQHREDSGSGTDRYSQCS